MRPISSAPLKRNSSLNRPPDLFSKPQLRIQWKTVTFRWYELESRDRRLRCPMEDEQIQFGPDPDYERPPVVETVLGIQFDQLPQFRNAHLGAFWKCLDQGEWTTVSDAPLLLQQFELFGQGAEWEPRLRFHLSSDPSCRLQIRNASHDRMIQVQNSRLHVNWLGKGDQPYPRHGALFDEFFQILGSFTNFVAQAELGEFRPNQWEITYINHLNRGTVWNSPAEWNFFTPLCGLTTLAGIAEGESFGGEWHFVIPGQMGRLHIGWQHGKEDADSPDTAASDFVRITLTGRGPVAHGGDQVAEIRSGLELGRKTIVHAFRRLTSKDANRFWGLKDAN